MSNRSLIPKVPPLIVGWNMKSNRQKREELAERRRKAADKKSRKRIAELCEICKSDGSIQPVDGSKVRSRSALPNIPEFYANKPFKCVGCGCEEVWTARQQKWWYEVAGGEIETTAIRCRKCRRKERERKADERRRSLEGKEKKIAAQGGASDRGKAPV